MGDLEQLKKWCEQARAILQQTGSKKGQAAEDLGKELARVTDGLTLLQAPLKGTVLLAGLEEEADHISSDAEILAKAPMDTQKQKDERRAQAKLITGRLHALAKQIDQAKPKARELTGLRNNLEERRKQTRSLATRPYVTEPLLAPLNAVLTKTEQVLKLDDLSTVATATQALMGYDKVKDEFLKAQQELEKQAAKNVRVQFDCVERLRVLRETLAHAQGVGIGVTVQIGTLQRAIEAAEKLGSEGKWSEALALLPGSLPTVSQVDEASKLALRALPPQALKAQQLLDEYARLVDTDMHTLAAQALSAKLQLATEQKGNAPKLVDEAVQQVTAAIAQARLALRQAETDEIEARKVVNTATPSLDVVTLQALNERLSMLRTDIEQKHLLQAAKYATELLADARSAAQTARQARKGWDEVAGDYAALAQRVGEAAKDVDAPQSEQSACRLAAEAALRSRSGLEQSRDWQALLGLHQGLLQRLEDFALAKQAYADFALLRNEGRALMALEFERLKTGLETVEKALAEAGGLEVETVLKPLRDRLSSAANVWEARLANATSTEALDAAGMEKLLQTLSEDVEAAALPENVAQAQVSQKEAQFEQLFRRMTTSMEQVFGRLEAIDIVQASQAREKLARLQADTKTRWEDKQPLLEEISASMQLALDVARKKQDGRADRLLKACDELERRRKEQLGKLNSTKDKAFRPAFEELDLQIKDLRALANTPNVSAADAAEKALAALDRKLKGLEAMSSDSSAFAKVRDMLAKVLSDLDDVKALLQENVPGPLKTLQESARELQTSVLSMLTDDAFVAIGSLQKSIDEARQQSMQVQSVRAGYNQLKDVVVQKIALLRTEGTVPVLVGVLQQRLDGIEGQAAQPTKLFSARQQLDGLHKDIEAAFLDPGKGLEMQQKARQSEEDGRLLKEKCESGLQHVKKVALKRASQAVKDAGGDKALLAEIARMIDETEKVVDGKDYADGARKIELVLKRIEEVVADPHGPGIGSRKALPEGAQRVGDSINKLGQRLRALPQAAAERLSRLQPPAALPESARSKLTGQIETLLRRLNPGLFKDAAVQLQDSKKPARERREVRESALAQLRELRALISDHPQFVALWGNPFDVEIKVAKNELLQRLTALEANIRRAVQ